VVLVLAISKKDKKGEEKERKSEGLEEDDGMTQ